MESKKIVLVKPGNLAPKQKEKLTKAGNLVIEVKAFCDISFTDFPKAEQIYTYINCATCGDRIYLLPERLSALKINKRGFYCSRGHLQSYS